MSDTFDAPGSRNEAILQNMLGANNPLEPPGSRIEDLLQQLLEEGSGSGLPDVTAADGDKILIVENGKWVVETADVVIDPNSSKPVSNNAVYIGLSNLENMMYDLQPIVRACDATAQFALEQMSVATVALVVPVDVVNVTMLFALVSTGYLFWTNGTKLDCGKVLVEIDMTNNAITLYARGKSSMVSGVMGVDTSWTVTSL